MKFTLFILAVFTYSGPIFANSCVDIRGIFDDCQPGNERFFNRGVCYHGYLAEHTYCAKEEMTDLKEVYGETAIVGTEPDGRVQVLLYGSGETYSADSKLVSKCKKAITLVGRPEAAGASRDLVKTDSEPLRILNFKCRK